MKEITFVDRASNQLISEKPPGEGFLKFLYHHPFGQLPLELVAKRKFLSQIYGRMMHAPSSRKQIKSFIEDYQIDMDEAIKSVDEFDSFNDFFIRKLKASARPIGDGLSSPADGKLIAFANVSDIGHFFVKGQKFNLVDFLQDKALADKFQNAAMMVVRLAPNDYHRFHFPYSGNASPPTQISGSYYSVSPYALAKNFTRVFCENKREYSLLSTPDKGDIIVSPVGATMVGSIIETYPFGQKVNKGSEMGYFAFGGSSILMLLEKGKFEIDADLLQNTKDGRETAVKMGEKIGI
ncbi:MAG: phosphatidylserine decarboxylase [Bacteroidia bacterium]